MADEKILFLDTKPGIKRDGTPMDSQFWTDGEWVRFQRGRPRAMGGYRRILDDLTGPVRKVLVWSRGDLNAIYSFSASKIEQVLVDNNVLGASIVDRTPTGFTPSAKHIWSVDTQYDDAVGTKETIVLAHASQSLTNIDDETASKAYWAVANGSSAFAQITDAPSVSGGVASVGPYTVHYGSDGYVEWSDINQPQTYLRSAGNIGDAGADRVTGSKIVRASSIRSGTGAAALLWSLDSVLRMDWVGGGAIFRFTTLSNQSSLLSQNSVIEYDGAYFWIGTDRFMYFDSSVKELPNDMNQNWFFDNLNYAQRQKVHAEKVPRFGEIWWFFPSGDNTECDKAVIFNVREKTWYDAEKVRSAGMYSQVLRYPIWASNDTAVLIKLASLTNFNVGDSVEGSSYRASGTVGAKDATYSTITVDNVVGTFNIGETVTSSSGGSTTSSYVDVGGRATAWQQEFGRNEIAGDFETAVCSSITSHDISLVGQGINAYTRLTRIEPDFEQSGTMTVEVLGREFSTSPDTVGIGYNFTKETDYIDTREQERHLRLRFKSNDFDGDFQLGKVGLHMESGDRRS